jgi:hypothetical protein
MEDNFYANLILTPDGKPKRRSENGSISQQNSRGKLFEMEDSPYSEHLTPRSRKLIQRGEYPTAGNRSINSAPGVRKSYSNSHGLQTSSESGLDTGKKRKKISSMGKKFMKRVQRSMSGRSKSNSAVAPLVGGEVDDEARTIGKPDWVDPNTKDYRRNLKG